MTAHHPQENGSATTVPCQTSDPGQVAASFGRAARSYQKYAHVQTAMATWLAEWLPDDRTGRALELGAGTGIFTRHLLPWPGQLTATDLSAHMCARGSERFPSAEWRVMDASQPDNQEWDWIFSSSMLQWLPEPLEALTRLGQRLRPGGRLLMGLFVAGSLVEWRSVSPAADPLRWRTVGQWREIVQAAGFRSIRDDTCWKLVFSPSAHAALRTLHRTGTAPVRRVGPGVLRMILDEYERRFRTPFGIPTSWHLYRFEAELGRIR